jgi:YggT family protein
MTRALDFLISTITSIVLFFFLLRMLLQFSRADFRNPIARGIVQLTNWLILPLRKVLPPMGRIDSASVVAVILIAAAGIGLQLLVVGIGLPQLDVWILATLKLIVSKILWLYLVAILISVVTSWIAPGGYSPAQMLVETLTEPVLRPIRRVLPPIGGFDFSALVVLIAIQFVLIWLGL